jgi:hypothetical protein
VLGEAARNVAGGAIGGCAGPIWARSEPSGPRRGQAGGGSTVPFLPLPALGTVGHPAVEEGKVMWPAARHGRAPSGPRLGSI